MSLPRLSGTCRVRRQQAEDVTLERAPHSGEGAESCQLRRVTRDAYAASEMPVP